MFVHQFDWVSFHSYPGTARKAAGKENGLPAVEQVVKFVRSHGGTLVVTMGTVCVTVVTLLTVLFDGSAKKKKTARSTRDTEKKN